MPTPDQEARQWLREFETACRGRDFDTGRRMFAEDAVAFGTWAMAVHGLANIEREQWRGAGARGGGRGGGGGGARSGGRGAGGAAAGAGGERGVEWCAGGGVAEEPQAGRTARRGLSAVRAETWPTSRRRGARRDE